MIYRCNLELSNSVFAHRAKDSLESKKIFRSIQQLRKVLQVHFNEDTTQRRLYI